MTQALAKKLSVFRVPSSWELRSGKLYLIASVLTGFFNYLFQVLAARQLSPQGYSELNGWFADLSLFFMFGGVLQYVANFRPAGPAQLRAVLGAANLFMIVALVYWLLAPGALTLDRALVILVVTALFGWITGQLQTRMHFGVLSAVGLIIGAAKLGIVGLPLESETLNRYALALFASFFPALWFASYFLLSAPPMKVTITRASWTAPLLLSVASALTPQFDMVLMHHTQEPLVFEAFAQASLFYRAIYFLIFILAQWLLPRQVTNAKTDSHSGFPAIALGGFVLSLGLALTSGWVGQYVLHWASPPSMLLVFATCLHMTLLALVFLRIQRACARGQNNMAAQLLGALGCEFALQLVLRPEVYTYLIAVMVAQTALLFYSRERATSRPSSAE